MPGVLSSNSSSDFSREVGKMASGMHLDIKLEDGPGELEDLANYILSSSSDFSISGHFSRDFGDSDSDLPDNEFPVDFIKLLDCPDIDVGPKLHRIKCEDGCNSCGESPRYSKYRVSERKDPFMGTGGMSDPSKESGRPSTILEQLMSPLGYDSESEELMRPKVRDTKTFSAWNTPKADDELDLVQPKSSDNIWKGVFNDNTDEDDDDDDDDDDDYDSSSQDVAFPDTPSPSTQSETVAGDDSDVDIETVTEAPRSADCCGYASQLSPAMSPSSPGPLQKLRGGSLLTILSASVTPNGRISAHSSASATAAAVSRSSLAGSLLSSRASSLLGQKRKLSKDRSVLSKTPVQSSYQHVLCTSNSVNFHDYAMSPGACTYPSPPSSSSSSPSSSTETGRPTVLSKRIYKRKQFSMDASEKEKQHHHNQLERNRRQKLADLFMDLRDEVPKIANQAKASKVLILNEAAFYIHDLKNHHRQQEDDISREQRRKEVLRNQLRSLQAQISSSG